MSSILLRATIILSLNIFHSKKVLIHSKYFAKIVNADMAEWLRRLTRNQFPSWSVGSNPTICVLWHFIGKCNYTTFDQVTPEVISSHFLGEHPSLKSVGEYTVREERKVFRSLAYVMALDKTRQTKQRGDPG